MSRADRSEHLFDRWEAGGRHPVGRDLVRDLEPHEPRRVATPDHREPVTSQGCFQDREYTNHLVAGRGDAVEVARRTLGQIARVDVAAEILQRTLAQHHLVHAPPIGRIVQVVHPPVGQSRCTGRRTATGPR